MSWTLLGSAMIASAVSISALLIAGLLTRSPQGTRFNLDAWLRRSNASADKSRRGDVLVATSAAFFVVAVAGAAVPYIATQKPTETVETDEQILAQLSDYAQSIQPAKSASTAAASQMMPEVDIMIERLAARLASAPDDVQGWRMLGWSYLNTGHFQEAVAAYAKAVELDPRSTEIKRAYEAAKAKAADSGRLEQVAAAEDGSLPLGGSESSSKATDGSEKSALHENDASIRAMVDGLADRLETSPRDVDGWISLVRSRVVLGETEAAAAASTKALDVFKDDAQASAAITAAATELGLPASN